MIKGGLSGIMQQAQKMQAELEKAQQELAAIEIEGQSGGGMVKVVMTGSHDVRRVIIDDSLMGDDKDMLEDLVAAAINDAVQKVQRTNKERMSGLAGGMSLPAGFKLPF